MNPTIELLLTRRSVSPRLLSQPAPTGLELRQLLTIAAHVPDHGRVVPWRFIVITPEGGARIGERIAAVFAIYHPEATAATLDVERGRLMRAPLVIAIISSPRENPKAPEWEQVLSAGAAAMSLVVAANAAGYASSWHTEWYAYDRRILAELGVASHERVAGFVHIGTPIELPTERARPALDDIVQEYGATGLAPYSSSHVR
jgi:nitroreductase